MPNSIGGLASGLDTTQLIDALMAGERAGRTRLESRQSVIQRQLTVWQDLSSKLGAVATATAAFSTGSGATAQVTSSAEDLVTAFASGSSTAATPGTFTFRVQQLAVAHQAMVAGFASSDQLVGAGRAVVSNGVSATGASLTDHSGLAAGRYEFEVLSVDAATASATVRFGGREQTVSTSGPFTVDDGNGRTAIFTPTGLKVGTGDIGVVDTDGTTTLGQLATKISGLNVGVSAAAIDLGDGSANPVNLVLSAAEAGTAHAIASDFSGLGGFAGRNVTDLRSATDARLVLADGLTTITRTSNRITDVVEGVTLDLKGADAGTDVTVMVGQDNARTVTAARAVVDALNSVVSTLKRNTSYDPATNTAATFTGDSRARRLADQLRTAMTYRDTGQSTQSLSQIGISLGRNGIYTLDETKFGQALADDHAGTMRLLAGGGGRTGAFAGLESTVKSLQAADGLVDGAIDAAQANIASYNTRLAAFDQRLALVENRIRKQYTTLETTMAQLSSQATGLSRALG